VMPRDMQLDWAAARRPRGAHGVSDQALVQTSSAGGADALREARLHAAGERRAREDHY
jgi:hypothetical protein